LYENIVIHGSSDNGSQTNSGQGLKQEAEMHGQQNIKKNKQV